MDWQRVYDNGTFYIPAWKHYGKEKSQVKCYMCGEDDIQACLGYKQLDICFDCVEDLENDIRRSKFKGKKL